MTASLRAWVLRVALPHLVRWVRLFTPRRRLVVVCGVPSTEGNVVELVRALQRRYEGRIVWLDPPSAAFRAAQGVEVDGFPRYSRQGVIAYLTAEAVFFTHGLFGMPRRVPRKATVNVWHGSGMKVMPRSLLAERRVGGPAADLLVSGARVWGDYYAGLSDLDPRTEVAVVGNPRVDALVRPVAAERWKALGLDPQAPLIVWMPTFRVSTGAHEGAGWSDVAGGEAAGVAELGALLAEVCAAHGVTFVVKAHPLDAAARTIAGAVQIGDADLEAAGLALYELLGGADALVSDASSVWTDYLLLDRPIGFIFPDAEEYRAGRGIQPDDALDFLPGPMISGRAEAEEFVAEVLGDDAARGRGAALRARSRERFGIEGITAGGSADGVLDALAALPFPVAARLSR